MEKGDIYDAFNTYKQNNKCVQYFSGETWETQSTCESLEHMWARKEMAHKG